MRVVVVTNTYPPGDLSGVGSLAQELARRLGTAGHSVAVLTRRPPAGDRWAVAVGGPKLLFPLLAGWRWLRLPAAATAEVVHVHESDGVVVALLLRLARRLGRPRGRARLVATLQVSYVEERRAVRPVRGNGAVLSRPTAGERVFAWLRAPLLAALGRLTARLADAVVAPSAATADELRRDYGARVAAVIPNGIAVGALPPPAASAATAGGPVVLYAGRLRSRKAVAVLLAAFARLQGRLPDVRLRLVGDGEQRRRLQAQAAALGLGEAVCLAGRVPRERLPAEMAAADLFCLPSIYEGLPLVLLEAMAAGLAVVATAVSGNPDAVADGETGLLVPPEDCAALAAALESLVRDPARRRRMGEAGRQRVAARFTIERVADEYLALWQGLVSSPAARR